MTRLAAVILFCAGATGLFAQQHPNFSGTWNLNLSESNYSDKSASKPDRLVISVQQKGESLRYRLEREQNGKKGSFDVSLTIGGDIFESDAAGVVTAEWKGDQLVIKTLYNPGQDRQSDQVETWSLSPDGKRLTDDMHIHPPNNGSEVHVRRVLDKQP